MPVNQVVARSDYQHQSEWCWAACISMLFNYYGHPVDQARIVQETYGQIANVPAFSGYTIAHALNRPWIDDNNVGFRAVLRAVFDAQAGMSAINNAQIVQAVSQGDPVIVGAGGHCTLATAIRYIPTPMGPNILQVGVVDPWPGRGLRGLTPPERVPVTMGGSLGFLAIASIS